MLKNGLKLALCILACLGVGALGSLYSVGRNLNDWYGQLNKPSFNPPGWVFAPVWTDLYILMGVAAFLVLRKGLDKRAVQVALVLFCLQLGLNALWSPLFFGLHRIGWALVDILALWLAIVATIWAFGRVTASAAVCLVPYLAWVSFASVLNASLWQLNR